MIKLVISYKDDEANMQVQGNTEEILSDFCIMIDFIENPVEAYNSFEIDI